MLFGFDFSVLVALFDQCLGPLILLDQLLVAARDKRAVRNLSIGITYASFWAIF